ncbi:MAG: hypothetical protein NZM09_12140 [Ignavibacterium sp.]|nr:hypothetical protein [Ignavibacterium sp.]MDW8376425.1 hypothetical protein [Ignavibacteriales bacterium]
MTGTKIKSSTQLNIDADLDLNGKRITNIGVPTNADDAATKRYVDELVMSLKLKKPVKVCIDVDLDGVIPGVNTFDNVTLQYGDRVLLIGQEDTKQNGIYTFTDSESPLLRAADAGTPDDLVSALVFVESGNVYKDTAWLCTSDPGDLAINWVRFGPSLGNTYTPGDGIDISNDIISVKKDSTLTVNNGEVGVNPSSVILKDNFVFMERLTGEIDGSNTEFSLVNTPLNDKLMLFRNGILLVPGQGNDYSISGNTIIFRYAPQDGDNLFACYLKWVEWNP